MCLSNSGLSFLGDLVAEENNMFIFSCSTLLFSWSLNHIFINFIWSTKKTLQADSYQSLSDEEINCDSFYCLIGIDLWSSTTKELGNHSPIGIPLWFLLEWKWCTLWLIWNFFKAIYFFSDALCVCTYVRLCVFCYF